ncbi:hypothetical protein KY318_02630 [Candidatus Woesearchaeota archaeon]|nr:hypothetical protein [Candidatus Woesearchaeota archaeon]
MKQWAFLLCVIIAFFSGYLVKSLALTENYIEDYVVVTGDTANTNAIYQKGNNPSVFSPENIVNMITNSRSPERISPFDWIKENQIHVYQDRVVLEINDPEWASFTDTNSMDPVIDETSHAIEIVPKSPSDIHIGDIVSYKPKGSSETIIHRVIGRGVDEEGVFFVMKGDNNPSRDPGKVRFEQIQRIVVAIIY